MYSSRAYFVNYTLSYCSSGYLVVHVITTYICYISHTDNNKHTIHIHTIYNSLSFSHNRTRSGSGSMATFGVNTSNFLEKFTWGLFVIFVTYIVWIFVICIWGNSVICLMWSFCYLLVRNVGYLLLWVLVIRFYKGIFVICTWGNSVICIWGNSVTCLMSFCYLFYEL